MVFSLSNKNKKPMEWKSIKQNEIQGPKLTGHSVTSIIDSQNTDQIYVFGGTDENNQCSPNLYYFDPRLLNLTYNSIKKYRTKCRKRSKETKKC